MKIKINAGLIGSAAVLGLSGIAFAGGSDDSTQDLMKRLAESEARLAELEAQNGTDWLTEARADEVRGLVHDVLADADTRASLLQTAGTSGYDNGIYIRSADGNWLLRTNFLMQQRFFYVEEDTEFNDEDQRHGFENPRTTFNLSGHVVSPDWFYNVRVNAGSLDSGDDDTTRVGTEWAYLGYDYGNGWSMSMGHIRQPFTREENVLIEHQLAVERSVVGYAFSAGDSTGIVANYEGDSFRFSGAFTNGIKQGSGLALGYDTEFAITARGEYLFNGNWDQFSDFTNPNGGESGFMVGGAVHFEEGEDANGTGLGEEDVEITILTADASLEFDGANVFAAIYYLDKDGGSFGNAADASPLGFVVQGGIHLNDAWEVFGRYEFLDFDTSTVDDASIITLGVNRYFARHNAKWTTDIGFSLNDGLAHIDSVAFEDYVDGFPADVTGWDDESMDDDGQMVLRTQLQILF